MQNVRPVSRTSLSKIACGLVSIIAFFSILTQRMMITTENRALELLASHPGLLGFRLGFDGNKTQAVSNFLSTSAATTSNGILSSTDRVVHPDITLSAENSSDIQDRFESTAESAERKSLRKHSKPKKKSFIDSFNVSHIMEINAYHPHYSPRNGTDISESQQLSLLRCPNQSKCIVPELQLEAKLKVYFCKHKANSGVRFYYLMREGLLLHPNVILVEEADMYEADFVIFLPGSAPWHKTECTNVSLASKMIVMDEFDGHTLFSPRKSVADLIAAYGESQRWYTLYFKRSFVSRSDGVFKNYPHFRVPDVYPMTYALAEAYLQHHFNFDRDIEVLCTLRGSPQMATRLRVQNWVAEYGITREIKNIVSSQLNKASRTTVNKGYFNQMYNSSIIVTVNPANWEGDFRLWESFATGALVMVDPLFVPHSYPLIDGVHVVYFSNQNKSDLFSKLDYYRKYPKEARKIAINGYFHTMKYHRTVNLVDYVLRSAHLQSAIINNLTLPNYTFTAQYINSETKKQHKEITRNNLPGSYHGHEE